MVAGGGRGKGAKGVGIRGNMHTQIRHKDTYKTHACMKTNTHTGVFCFCHFSFIWKKKCYYHRRRTDPNQTSARAAASAREARTRVTLRYARNMMPAFTRDSCAHGAVTARALRARRQRVARARWCRARGICAKKVRHIRVSAARRYVYGARPGIRARRQARLYAPGGKGAGAQRECAARTVRGAAVVRVKEWQRMLVCA